MDQFVSIQPDQVDSMGALSEDEGMILEGPELQQGPAGSGQHNERLMDNDYFKAFEDDFDERDMALEWTVQVCSAWTGLNKDARAVKTRVWKVATKVATLT